MTEDNKKNTPAKSKKQHHLADEPVGEVKEEEAIRQSPVTDSGLAVERQVRKEWDPKRKGGLPTFWREFFRTGAR